MFTRSEFDKLKLFDSLKCLCCGEYWGNREELYVCSKCSESVKIKKDRDRINYDKDIKLYLKNHNMDIIDDKAVNHLELILKKTLILTHGALDTANLIYKYMQAFQQVDNPKSKILLLSDKQAIQLLKASNWREYQQGYKISHIILRWKITPWSTVGFKEYSASSFCYYGNFGEVPSSTKVMDSIYARAHSSDMSL